MKSAPVGVGPSNNEFAPNAGLVATRGTALNERQALIHNGPTFCCPAHIWVTSDDTISTEVCMGSGASVSSHKPANARCLHQLGWTHSQDFHYGHISGESKCTKMTWTHPGVLRYPHQGGLHTPDMVALVASVAQNHLAGTISAPAHSAMEIGPPVESICVRIHSLLSLDYPQRVLLTLDRPQSRSTLRNHIPSFAMFTPQIEMFTPLLSSS